MKKIKTLKMNYEFKNAFSKGKYYIGKQIIVYIMKNNLDYNRIGIAISTKLCNAVKRNKIKRVVRAVYQSEKNLNLNGYDIVFTWNKKSKVEDLNFNIVLEDMKYIFLKSGLKR